MSLAMVRKEKYKCEEGKKYFPAEVVKRKGGAGRRRINWSRAKGVQYLDIKEEEWQNQQVMFFLQEQAKRELQQEEAMDSSD